MSGERTGKVVCEGYFDIPRDQIETVLTGYEQHVRESRKEPGNLAYTFVFDPEIEGRVHVHEVYVDQAAFDAHLTRTKASPWPQIRKDVSLHIDVRAG